MDILKTKKINSLILYTVCSLLSLSMNGQGVVVRNMKFENPLKSKFHFEIINSSAATQFYIVAMEVFGDDNSWIEIRSDAFSNNNISKK